MAERRAVIAGLSMLLTATALSLPRHPRRLANDAPLVKLESQVPAKFGPWSEDESEAVVLPAPDVQRRLDALYSQILARSYIDSRAKRMMLLIAYGADQNDRTTLAHLPDACYPSQGFKVDARERKVIAVNGKPFGVVHLQTHNRRRVEPVTYWTVVGEDAYNDELPRRIARARYALKNVIPDGMLVRVSSIDSNATEAFLSQAKFVDDLYNALAINIRTKIFGMPTARRNFMQEG